MNQDVVSFVLRFVREEGGGQPARWRGVIRHVQSDHSADFGRFHDALQFMQAHVDEAIQQAFLAQETLSPEHILAETTRLWGEMAPRYTEVVLQSMEMMLEQGRRIGETLAQNLARPAVAVSAPGAQPPYEEMLHLVERLTAQVETLTAKVEALEERLRGA